jgi:hypothetical protein
VVKNRGHISSGKQGKDSHGHKCELLKPPMPCVKHPTLPGKMIGPPFGLQLFFPINPIFDCHTSTESNQMCYKAKA